jgi:hypothetical protein
MLQLFRKKRSLYYVTLCLLFMELSPCTFKLVVTPYVKILMCIPALHTNKTTSTISEESHLIKMGNDETNFVIAGSYSVLLHTLCAD